MTITLRQGVDESIIIPDLVDDSGAALDPTGWAIAAVVRHWGDPGPVVATWSDDPSEGEGQANVIDAGANGKQIELVLTPGLSAAWEWSRGQLMCKATEPDGEQRTARFADELVLLDFDITEGD